MPTNKDELINKMIQARSRLDTVLAKVTPQVEIYPSWKLKQLMDHITGWDELVASAFRTHSQGGTPELTAKHGIDRYNALSVEQRKGLTLEQSHQAYESARAAVLQAIREMPDDKVEQRFPAPWGGMCTLNSVVKIFVSHEQEHARQIEEALA